LELGITTRAGDIASVVNLITGFKQCDIGANGIDNTTGVPAMTAMALTSINKSRPVGTGLSVSKSTNAKGFSEGR